MMIIMSIRVRMVHQPIDRPALGSVSLAACSSVFEEMARASTDMVALEAHVLGRKANETRSSAKEPEGR
jgi:hypothetical protein